MTSKPNKSFNIWSICNNCNAYIVTKEKELHLNNCPPSIKNWKDPFILNNKLYSFLDTKIKDAVIGLEANEINNFVFISQSVIQLCNFKIGDSVLVRTSDHAPVILSVWPTVEKASTSVLITENALSTQWENLNSKEVIIESLPTCISDASEIILEVKNAPKYLDFTEDITRRLQRQYINKVFCKGNRLSILYYGKILLFTISQGIPANSSDNIAEKIINLQLTDDSEPVELFKIVDKTRIILGNVTDSNKPKKTEILPELGGLQALNNKINILIDTLFKKSTKNISLIKSVLIYGAPGTGKSSLARCVAYNQEKLNNTFVLEIKSSNILSEFIGETENQLKKYFNEIIENAPSIVIFDDVDILCPNRSTKPSEQEKRLTACLINFLDNLNENNHKVFVLATCTKPDLLDNSLRRYGRIDKEIEIPIPNEIARVEIFRKILNKNMKHSITDNELKELASLTPGYVGSDIMLVCITARTYVSWEQKSEVNFMDIKRVLKEIKPTAMREVQIESPDVSWSDIGGQDTLKFKLRQAIEWPLIHAESFRRMGIKPPRGVLMFGPPGCSKTMIAKALASETKLNFLSIKGPELFNKYVGESERAVRDLFQRARTAAPSIVFFDEIDAIGSERGVAGTSGGVSVQERVLAQLLTELDGVTALGDVTVVAATNRPDRIDKALLRPGRLDRIIYVPLPDKQTRLAIFKIKTSKMPITPDLDLNYLVERTDGYSGAEVQAVCNEAALKALEENILATEINMNHFRHALELVTPRTPKSLLDIYDQCLEQ